MIYEKKQFESEIENISKKYKKTKAEPLLKDLSDCITFSCIYAGRENAEIGDVIVFKKSNLNYEIVSDFKNIDKNKIFTAKRLFLNSYDKTLELTVIVSSQYIAFERLNNGQNYRYKSEYFLDSQGNFVRQCILSQEKLNKVQDVYELSEGTLTSGVYSNTTYEKKSNMKVECFKLPSLDKKSENVYIKYLTYPNSLYMCKTTERFNKVPYLEILGMNSLANMLSDQFEGDVEPMRIDDEQFFDHLMSACRTYYYKKQANRAEKK